MGRLVAGAPWRGERGKAPGGRLDALTPPGGADALWLSRGWVAACGMRGGCGRSLRPGGDNPAGIG